MVHGPHENQPGYHPDQILHDGCAECEDRGRHITAALNAMDRGRFAAAWERAAEWNRSGLDSVSHAERDLLAVLWLIQVKLESRGVPIGVCPSGPSGVFPGIPQ